MSDAASFALGLVGTALIITAGFAFMGDSVGAGIVFFALGYGAFALAAKGR